MILVGNKIDLRGDQEMTASLAKKDQVRKSNSIIIQEHKYDIKYQITALAILFLQVPVSTEKTKAMANKINAHAYVECSAKELQGVQEVFETAAKAALKKNRSSIINNLPRRCPIL